MNGSLVWVELPGGADCHVTGTFYASVFGWDVDDDGTTVRFRDPSGRVGGAFVGHLEPANSGGPLLYLGSDDLDATVSAAVAKGAGVVLGPTLIAEGVGRRALLRDPAGSVLGVFEPAASPH
jgi:uncharacterized protein